MTTPAPQRARGSVDLVRLSDVTPIAVRFEWDPYIVAGKVNNFQGEGGMGKSFVAVDICARITTGRGMPGQDRNDNPANVLYLTIEDDPADTILPRLHAAGGDPTRFYCASATIHHNDDGTTTRGALSLQHIPEIRDAVQQIRPALVVIDPVTSFLGAGVDMHRSNEVRPVLEALSQLAREETTTILNILHVGKSGLGSAAYRALGSVDFGNVARSILIAAEHEDRRVLAHAKINLAPRGPSLYYAPTPSNYTLGETTIPRIEWQGEAPITAEDLVNATRSRGGPTAAFLPEELDEHIIAALTTPLTAAQLEKEIRQGLGISRHQYEAARARLKNAGTIRHKRHGYGPDSTVYWYRTDRPVYWEGIE